MTNFKKLQKEFADELTDNILNYWVKRVYDPQRKTFIGLIDHNEKANPEAPLGVVLISRILWTFSAAYTFYSTVVYKKIADEAYHILSEHFMDKEHGGVFWEVSPGGFPMNTTKQSYAQAFAIYALSEYARVFADEKARQQAVDIFHLVNTHLFDRNHGGYFEAASQNWKEPVRDFITPSGGNMKKSMNTHLHLLEAFTNLYRVYPDIDAKATVNHILDIFIQHIINLENYHFHMFFDADWTVMTSTISFGHDIEGTWLLNEAAEVTRDHDSIEKVRPLLLKMAYATGKEAIDKKGGLYNEFGDGHWDRDFHWWPQAEAVVGFFNAYQLTGDQKFLKLSEKTWKFIQKYQVDHKNGEWFWLISPEYIAKPMVKVSAWKCPYHNGRMCMEMIRRLENE